MDPAPPPSPPPHGFHGLGLALVVGWTVTESIVASNSDSRAGSVRSLWEVLKSNRIATEYSQFLLPLCQPSANRVGFC